MSTPRPLNRAPVLAAGALSLVAGCGRDPALAPGTPAAVAATPARVILTAAADTLAAGEQRRLTATVADARGAAVVGAAVAWASSDPRVATVDAGGALVALAPGQAELWATSAGARGTMIVVVRPRPVADLAFESAPDTVWIGRAATLRAHPVAADGMRLEARALGWSTPDTALAEVAADSSGTVTVRAERPGVVRLVATSESVVRTLALRAIHLPVATLTLAGPPDTLAVGTRVDVRAAAIGPDGQPLTEAERGGRTIAWESADPAVARVDAAATGAGTPASATLEARAPGVTTIRARLDGRVVEATVVVPQAGAGGATVRVFPTAITAQPGATGRLTAQVADRGTTGSTFAPTASVAWRSSDPSVVTVDATGRVTMRAAGTAEVLATTPEGTVGRSVVTVQDAPAGAFRIALRPVGEVPEALLAAARRAAARWERVIVGSLPAQGVALAADACDAGTPAVHETVRDLVIFLRVAPIDGARGTLAYAGPCVVRRGGLPVLGVMVVDAGDAEAMSAAADDFATDVMAHEIGHVLGIGTLWNGTAGAPALLVNPTGADLRFGGASAVEAAARTGLTGYGAAVPVEQDGGEGTAGGHWREQVFRGELMTGWVNSAPNPLSIVTVGALRDLGFQVSETGADVVSPVSASGGAAFLTARRPSAHPHAMTLTPEAERLIRPRWEVGPDGRPVRARRR